MTDHQRRLLCRTAFLSFCLLPTLVVANWALFPRTHSEWRMALQQNIGLLFRFESIATPTPYRTMFSGVQIADPRRQLLAQIPQFTWEQNHDLQVIEVGSFAVSAADLTRGCRQLLTAACNGTSSLQLHVKQLDIIGGTPESSETLTLHNCRVGVQHSASGTTVTLTFATQPDGESDNRWDFQSLGSADSALAGWTINVPNDHGQSGLPCWLLTTQLPLLSSLGPHARFSGRITSYDGSPGRIVELQDVVLDQVDLATAFTARFGFDVEGSAHIAIPRCKLVDGRVAYLNARFYSPCGRMNQSLLSSASDWLYLQCAKTSEPIIEFKQLAFDLEYRGQLLFLRHVHENGALAFTPSDTVLAVATERSLGLPVCQLLYCLARNTDLKVPADPAVLGLLSDLANVDEPTPQ